MLLSVKKDGKFLLLSVFLHCLIFMQFMPIGCGGGKSQSKTQGEKTQAQPIDEHGKKKGRDDGLEILPKIIEVSLVERSPEKEKGLSPIPKPKEKVRSKDGYWGIGIYTNLFTDQLVIYSGAMYSGIAVNGAIAGNPAAVAGLQRGDIIFMVDNMPVSDKNEVKGSGPRAMILHVKRGESIFTVPIERGWIETRKGNSP